MGILSAKKKKPLLSESYIKNISKKIPGEKKIPETFKRKLEQAREKGFRHRVPEKALEEFLKGIEMIDKGESLETVVNMLKERGIHDPRMFKALAKRAEEREK